jgi:hypothetical protein
MAALFFAPAAILGTVSPIVAKLALRDLRRSGRTVGSINAAGTAGSIAGTLATGFVLVPFLDTHAIVACVSALLVAVGLSLVISGRGRVARRTQLPVVRPTATAGGGE